MNYWDNRDELKNIAANHSIYCAETFPDQIKECVQNTKWYSSYYHDMNNVTVIGPGYQNTSRMPNQIVVQATTTDCLFTIPNFEKVTLLNFASYTNPGGKFLEGSSAQEESLCHNSFLYNVLSQFPKYYEHNMKTKDRGLYKNNALYSPNVLFFNTIFQRVANVITCAAPNYSVSLRYKSFSSYENLEALNSRMIFIGDIVRDNKYIDILILGAWGCGVFKQNPEIVAAMFKTLFCSTYHNIGKVVYAIPDYNTYKIFKDIIN